MSALEIFSLHQSELSPGFQIGRALPQRQLRRIGAWAFLDHIGPVELRPGLGMKVHSHPHIGLQTFTWMVAGEIEHHDSLGYRQTIRPGEINLMTSGDGIAHTETSVGTSGRMHAAQLWLALPAHKKDTAAAFEHHQQLPQIVGNGWQTTLLVGEWLGQQSPVAVHTPLIAVDVLAQVDCHSSFKLNPVFEYGILPMEGELHVNGELVPTGSLAYLGTGHSSMQLQAAAHSRALVIGGEPLEEELIVWWNFIARSQAEIEQARADWEAQSARYGELGQLGEAWLHAPEITATLKSSGSNQR